jgi:hypothetical protein
VSSSAFDRDGGAERVGLEFVVFVVVARSRERAHGVVGELDVDWHRPGLNVDNGTGTARTAAGDEGAATVLGCA